MGLKNKKIYYTSDLHLVVEKCLKCKIIYTTAIFNNINQFVKQDDVLCILGDITFSDTYGNSKEHIELYKELLCKIKCNNIKLIQGNHDDDSVFTALSSLDKVISADTTLTTIEDSAFGIDCALALSHYPILDYHNSTKLPLVANIHGHSHGTLLTPPDLFDVDFCTKKRPMTFEELLSEKYGHYENPYIGWINDCRKYRNKFAQFYKEYEAQR